MRKSLVLAMVAVLACSSLALAGVPDPARSGGGTSGSGASTCHYYFTVSGMSGETMNVDVTLRDAFDTPVASCSTSVTVDVGVDGCACGGGSSFRLTGFSDGSGIVSFAVNDQLGGFGSLSLAVTTHCAGAGNIEILTESGIAFTSPDLNGSCESLPSASTNVFDLGQWAGGLPPSYDVNADYNCDGVVNVFDLGDFAQGLGVGCQ